MKIQAPPLPSSVRTNAADSTGAPSQGASAKRPSLDQTSSSVQAAVLTISSQGRDLAAVKSAPAVRPEKVSSLRNQISDGTYSIVPEKIAERMVDDLLAVA